MKPITKNSNLIKLVKLGKSGTFLEDRDKKSIMEIWFRFRPKIFLSLKEKVLNLREGGRTFSGRKIIYPHTISLRRKDKEPTLFSLQNRPLTRVEKLKRRRYIMQGEIPNPAFRHLSKKRVIVNGNVVRLPRLKPHWRGMPLREFYTFQRHMRWYRALSYWMDLGKVLIPGGWRKDVSVIGRRWKPYPNQLRRLLFKQRFLPSKSASYYVHGNQKKFGVYTPAPYGLYNKKLRRTVIVRPKSQIIEPWDSKESSTGREYHILNYDKSIKLKYGRWDQQFVNRIKNKLSRDKQYSISIRVVKNNQFLTLTNTLTGGVVYMSSSGKFKNKYKTAKKRRSNEAFKNCLIAILRFCQRNQVHWLNSLRFFVHPKPGTFLRNNHIDKIVPLLKQFRIRVRAVYIFVKRPHGLEVRAKKLRRK